MKNGMFENVSDGKTEKPHKSQERNPKKKSQTYKAATQTS